MSTELITTLTIPFLAFLYYRLFIYNRWASLAKRIERLDRYHNIPIPRKIRFEDRRTTVYHAAK